MISPSGFQPIKVPNAPRETDCVFYHASDFDDGTSVAGAWDLRAGFAQYIGNYPVAGKTLLDVGTASGFLAFEAERAGAIVTAIEGVSTSEYCQLHFSGLPFHEDRKAFIADADRWFETLKNGFWYCWHKRHSNVEVVYTPLSALPFWDRTFDVVLAGAILEHLSDPVATIWNLTRLARECVIIAFTPVLLTDEPLMRPATAWSDPAQNFTWWNLSLGLYRRIFDNVGFDVELVPAIAHADGVSHERPTIIARRRNAKSTSIG